MYAHTFFRALRAGACRELLSLDLSCNELYHEGTRELISALANGACPLLEELSLNSNAIGK